MDALKYLGIENPKNLPEYEKYHALSFDKDNQNSSQDSSGEKAPGELQPEAAADAFASVEQDEAGKSHNF